MDDDFFLQDQDYSDSWVDHVTTGSFTRVNTATGATTPFKLSQSSSYEGLLVLNSGELLAVGKGRA